MGCSQKNGVEILPNNEKDYKFVKHEYWQPNRPEVLSFTYEQVKAMSIAAQKINIPGNFEYSIFINENGIIDKIRPEVSASEEIDKMLAKEMEKWKMNQFFVDNKFSKYKINWSINVHDSLEKFKYGGTSVSSNFPLIETHYGGEYFVMVDKMPEPIDGVRGIQEKIKYPENAKKDGVQGRVYIKAFIDSLGNVAATEILKGLGSGCDEAAIEAVKQTKFIPGALRDKPVGVQVSIPILFKLDDSK